MTKFGRRPLVSDDIADEMAAAQTHCYVCGNPLGNIRWRCHICKELHCSEECRTKHMEAMDKI